jgi:hypothetical protein
MFAEAGRVRIHIPPPIARAGSALDKHVEVLDLKAAYGPEAAVSEAAPLWTATSRNSMM